MKKIIKFADYVVNLLIILFLLPILLCGIYTIWDSEHIYQQAESSLYETYKPTTKEQLSFKELQKINSEVFGWLTIKNTHIDYPLVQASDNLKYVNTNAKGEFSLSGSLFLDCRNANDFSDVNNIIYGHHMEKQLMFEELDKFAKEKYFKSHRYGKVYFDGLWHKIEFFAFLHTDAYDPMIYNTELYGKIDNQQYLNYIRRNAKRFRELDFDEENHFITLSTCNSASTNGRYILVGRIIVKKDSRAN